MRFIKSYRPSRMRQVSGVAQRPASRRAPNPRLKELYGAGGHSADAEQPPLVAVLVGQRAEQHHGVEVDVRVEKRQRRAHRPDVYHRDRRRFNPW